MNYTLEAHISSNSLKQDVVNTAMATAEKRTGRISSSDDEQMKIYFGSRIKTRFFGVWFLSESKKFQFPTKLQIDLRHVDDQHFFTLKFSDDLGETIPDSYSRNSYDRYYRSIIDDFCQKLQVIRVEIIKENNIKEIYVYTPIQINDAVKEKLTIIVKNPSYSSIFVHLDHFGAFNKKITHKVNTSYVY